MNAINISVITSLYKCAPFLESFLMHYANLVNLEECELILVHNDPSEEELAIIARCASEKMNIVHLRVRREGLYVSWNRAVEIARGKYLAVWNVDDIRSPESLAAQKLALDSSEAVMCYGDFFGTRAYGLHRDKLYTYASYKHCYKEALRRHIIGCFPMWRKDLHEKVGYFDEQFRLVSDYEFQLRVASSYPLVKATPILGYYLEHAGHKLSSNRRLQTKERTAVELRYRMYRQLLLHVLPFIAPYRVGQVRNYGLWIDVRRLVPGLRSVKRKEIGSLLQMPFTYAWWFVQRSFQALQHRLLP